MLLTAQPILNLLFFAVLCVCVLLCITRVCRQWLFIIEAIPSLLMGVVIWCWLPSHPLTAWMLTPRQRQLVHQKV